MFFVNIFYCMLSIKTDGIDIILIKQPLTSKPDAMNLSLYHQLYIIGSDIIIEKVFKDSYNELLNSTGMIGNENTKEIKYTDKYIVQLREMFSKKNNKKCFIISIKIPYIYNFQPLFEKISELIKGVKFRNGKDEVGVLCLRVLKCHGFKSNCKKCCKRIKKYFPVSTKSANELRNIKIRINFSNTSVYLDSDDHLNKHTIIEYNFKDSRIEEPETPLISNSKLSRNLEFIYKQKKNLFSEIEISTSPKVLKNNDTTYIVFDWRSSKLLKKYKIGIININIKVENTEDDKYRLYTCNYEYNNTVIQIPIKYENLKEADVNYNYFEEVNTKIERLNKTRSLFFKKLNSFLVSLEIVIGDKIKSIKKGKVISHLQKVYKSIDGITSDSHCCTKNELETNCILKDQNNIKRIEDMYNHFDSFRGQQECFKEILTHLDSEIIPSLQMYKATLNDYKKVYQTYKESEIKRRLLKYSEIIFNSNQKFSFIITFTIQKKNNTNFIVKNYITVSRMIYEP